MKQSNDIHGLKVFITTLGEKQALLKRQWVMETTEALATFLPEVGKHGVPIIEGRKTHAPKYNLFEILKIRHYEAKVHTPFLVNLMSPNGSHGQGNLFYSAFAEKVFKKEKDVNFLNFNHLHVTDEYHTEDLGNIDIWIRNYDPANRHCVIIENKIYAKDQPSQLQRYYDYAKVMGYDDEHIRLFYLTLKPGGTVSEKTMNEQLRIRLEKGGILRYINYRNHILPWLEEVDCPAQTVKEVIRQYIKTIRALTR